MIRYEIFTLALIQPLDILKKQVNQSLLTFFIITEPTLGSTDSEVK